MPSQYISVKKYTGVCYIESKSTRFRGRPDRIYWVRFKEKGKIRYERCGRASEGWTPEAAQNRRFELLEHKRTGKYKSKDQRKSKSITLNQLFDDYYLPWAKKKKKRPADDISRFNHWVRENIGNKSIDEINPDDISSILNQMEDAGKAAATRRQVFALIRHIFNKAIENEWWEGTNPCSGIKPPQVQNARIRFLQEDEAALLLQELRKLSIQTAQIAELSLFTGMRRGEIFNLKWKDVNVDQGMITILDTKNQESRTVFITKPVAAILGELTVGKKHEYLFTDSKSKRLKWLSNTFDRTVKKIGFNTGIDDNRQRVSFHTLRHTFASWAALKGVPIYHLSKAMGHKTTAMTERYSHLLPENLLPVFEAVANSKSSKEK